MVKFKIRETDEYDALVELFMKEGLEYSEDDLLGNDPVPTEIVKCWSITLDENDRLVGGAVLATRQGEYIVDGIAMDSDFQRIKLGKELMMRVIEEVLKRNGKALYLVARAPEFFRKIGFDTIDRDEAPEFFECAKCPQRDVTCHPEVMKLSMV